MIYYFKGKYVLDIRLKYFKEKNISIIIVFSYYQLHELAQVGQLLVHDARTLSDGEMRAEKEIQRMSISKCF